MTKRFIIAVTEIGQETRTIGGEWKQGAGDSDGYGYTPQIEAVRDYEREVFRQQVTDLDLPSLVRTINPEGAPQ